MTNRKSIILLNMPEQDNPKKQLRSKLDKISPDFLTFSVSLALALNLQNLLRNYKIIFVK